MCSHRVNRNNTSADLQHLQTFGNRCAPIALFFTCQLTQDRTALRRECACLHGAAPSGHLSSFWLVSCLQRLLPLTFSAVFFIHSASMAVRLLYIYSFYLITEYTWANKNRPGTLTIPGQSHGSGRRIRIINSLSRFVKCRKISFKKSSNSNGYRTHS